MSGGDRQAAPGVGAAAPRCRCEHGPTRWGRGADMADTCAVCGLGIAADEVAVDVGEGRRHQGCVPVPRLEHVLAESVRHTLAIHPWGRDLPRQALAALREACTIRTVEELDALPEGAIVRDGLGNAWRQSGRFSPVEPWWVTGSEIERAAEDISLPALLLWHPDWSES